MPKRERGVSCHLCGELRWYDPTKQQDPGCICGRVVKRANITRTFDVPIEMYSIGAVEADEMETFKKHCPDVELNPEGVPVVKNRHQKKQVLKLYGFEEKN